MAGDTAGTRPCPAASIPLRPGVLGGKISSTICCFIIKRGVYKSKPICCQTNCQIAELLREGAWRGFSPPHPLRLPDHTEYRAPFIWKNNESEPPPDRHSHACSPRFKAGPGLPQTWPFIPVQPPHKAAPGVPGQDEFLECWPSVPDGGEKALRSASIPSDLLNGTVCPGRRAWVALPPTPPPPGGRYQTRALGNRHFRGRRRCFCTLEMARMTEQPPGFVQDSEPGTL